MFTLCNVLNLVKTYYVISARTIPIKSKKAQVMIIGYISFDMKIWGRSSSTAFMARLPSGCPYSL